MQDTRTNRLVAGEMTEKMKKALALGDTEGFEEEVRKEFDATGRVRRADQGPVFVEGEVVPVKGYGYKVHALVGQRIILMPHGPLEEGG